MCNIAQSKKTNKNKYSKNFLSEIEKSSGKPSQGKIQKNNSKEKHISSQSIWNLAILRNKPVQKRA